jgi:AcrR family transcriptional regulator
VARRPGLDAGVIVRAAADLVDTDGIEALALGRLAERLGVRAPSLYNHVASLDGVRRGLALLGARELGARLARAAIGATGEEGVFALAEAYRRFAKERPGLYAATLRAPDPDDHALQEVTADLLGVVRAVLAPYGLRGAEETHAIRAWRSLVHGFVSLEITGGFGLPLDLDESFRRLIHLFIAGLSGLCGEGRGAEPTRPAPSREEMLPWHARS